MVDENGYYKITGRIKDMIIRGGENIYPKEIEEFLYTHPSVQRRAGGRRAEQAVRRGDHGLRHPARVGGRLDRGRDRTRSVRENMARHKVPKYVLFMDQFPMTASGKIQKFKLREMGIEKFGLQDDAAVETA